MGRTLITRATGFVGASLVRKLLENSLTVRAEPDDRNFENFGVERVAVDAYDARRADDTSHSHATLARARTSTAPLLLSHLSNGHIHKNRPAVMFREELQGRRNAK